MKDRCIHAVSVTDASGVAIQHLEIDRREIREPPLKLQQGREQYMAFGEVFVDERRTGFGTPYKFNGKELDCESGYYYYSARYYDPRMARFLSAVSPRASHGMDPLAGEFPSQSSYLYAYNNPVRMIDVDGLYGDEGEATEQRTYAISLGYDVGEVYQSGDEWGFNRLGENDEVVGTFDRQFGPKSPHTLSEYKPNVAEQIRESGFVGEMVYGAINAPLVTFQQLNPLDRYNTNLDGSMVTGSEKWDALANTAATFVPLARTASPVKSLLPKGLQLSKFNAAQFSKQFKGTSISSSAAQIRGILNRHMNKGIDQLNNTVQGGGMLLQGAKISSGNNKKK